MRASFSYEETPSTMTRSYVKHGLVTLDKAIKRRTRKGRSLIDRRSAAGKNAMRIHGELIADLGGIDNVTTAKLLLVELIARDVYFADETDRRIFNVLKTIDMRKTNPGFVSKLYAWRSGVVNNLARNLMALGLEKQHPPAKTLDEILAEDDENDENETEQQANGSAAR
jgi:hypothetical protein